LSEKQEEIGVDLKLQFDPLGVDLATDLGDLDTITDEDNLVQAIIHRLTTWEGELEDIGHADYGSRLHEVVGEVNDKRTRERLKNLVHACLEAEPRIMKIVDIKAVQNLQDLHRVDIDITVLPVGKRDLIKLIYTFNLEGK
jgi:phage baseplate assembly protein W